MRSRTVCRLIQGAAIAAALLCSAARADQPSAIPRVGVLVPQGDTHVEEGLRQGFSELGYVEGTNLIIEWRRYPQSSDARQAAATALVRSGVDVIVAEGTQAARAALSATSTVPVVFLSGDPVGSGLAASLARPGGNGTGLSSQTTELMPKRLQLLLQIAPRTRRVILLMNADSPLHAVVLEETQRVTRTLRLQLITLNARNGGELYAALRGLQRNAGDAFVISSDVFFIANKDNIAAAVRKAKLPTVVPTKQYRGNGVLMSYGPSLNWTARRAATYVDRILKGAKPADLPVEQVSKFELIIDLRAARELGLTVPEELLLRADEVIR